ncbi:DUF6436 domain-containing protein [Pseudoalteromonas spongiae]|uniref:DUF6436 domain-containing protein n=1 Tax=Pseudoalteromonas spongiae TaxID=298657 RepID=UPI000C2D5F19|nr:DUF6436 domain-containing protein [Pseudoalteromonas spongiae]
MSSKLHWVLLAVWSIILTSSVLYLSTLKAKQFDVNGLLLGNAMDTQFDHRFTSIVEETLDTRNGAVVHFTMDNCFCEYVAQSHVMSVKNLASEHGFKNHVITLKSNNRFNIPSVPAVAVINQNGKLTYLGPYATGMFCSEGEGLVEQYINDNTEHNELGATILTDAQGCYCNLG